MMVCQVCQHENPAGAEFCEECGAALSVAPPTPVGAGVSAGGTAASPSAPVSAPVVPTTSSSSSAAASPAASSSPSTPSSPPDNAAAASSSADAPTTASPVPSAASDTAAAPAAPATPSSQTAGAQARLLAVRYGAPTGQEIPLFGQRLVVGRFDPETGPVDVDLSETPESGHISRQHGELYRDPDGSWMVRDLGSTNGVFVKSGEDASFGPRITAPQKLRDGDEVAFGNARFVFTSS